MEGEEPRMNSQFLILISNEQEKRVEEYEKQLEELKNQEMQKNYENTGVPEKFYKSTIDTYTAQTEEEKRNKAAIIGFKAKPGNKILFLCGMQGNGKTHLACAVLRETGGIYTTACKICIEYESATSYHAARTREELLISLSKSRMLVNDDCGKYTLNPELEKFLISQILMARYENDRPTFLITNVNKKK